ncbi:tRNA uridine-5-carboxymethylaminomethyl(34) synthesis GTPase MnmE [Mycoplasmopsis lipofaciens]|uniref:tRNA uridine-5-carboxymethylaminomethyl(34) synthesis GTPase MnmE n=1 Tax=Mycoplasmopsis lipofaciens TaxID=114884 RepID=UPI0004841E45|nr:tRNA uridine-5-carboxymethylaminomethyl(34) synthesis GTPase MnmE [Mycoplasmopsis lipofaciens]
MINDTIVAISSGGKINQAISIIRMSGSDSIKILKKIFKGKTGENQKITYGHIINNLSENEIIDEVLVMWYIGSNNFVGEDTVEINCHGGVIVTNQILELLLANGARLALPGEFSRRSFLNGKMDLIKAEAINDLIHAQTISQTNLAIKKFNGNTSKMIQSLIDELSYLIGQIEVNIDYPEYDDIEQIFDKDLKTRLLNYSKKLDTIIKNSENSRLIFDGIKVAIIGRPNVGKSSILNCLLEEDKAIVTDIAGTTRDIVEASWQFEGMLFKLIDTAGIRQTKHKIEKIGIEKSIKQIKESDVVIYVKEINKKDSNDNKLIEEVAQKYNKPVIKVINKIDIAQNFIKNSHYCYVSAINNDIENLKIELKNHFKDIKINNDDYLSNTRQLSLIKQAQINIKEAIVNLDFGYGYDVVIVDIREAWKNLQDISGRADNEKLLDEMFKNFCLGK